MDYMIYPFSENIIPIVQYIEKYKKDINISRYVCPNAWIDRISSISDKNLDTDFEKVLSEVDGVVICDVAEYDWLYQDTIKKLLKAVSLGKEIICSLRIKEKDWNRITGFVNYSEERFHYLVKDTDPGTLNSDYLKRIDAIIVGVGKLIEGLDNSTILYGLYNELKERGYSVITVGLSPNNYLCDGYEFPKDIFGMAGKNRDKVLLINDYFNQLQEKTASDIIIVQFPDSLMKYSDELQCDFGVDSFILSKALSVDYFVTSVAVEYIEKSGLDGIFSTVKNQYSFEVDGLCADNKILDFPNSSETGTMTYEYADSAAVDEYIKFTEENMEDRIIISKNDRSGYKRLVDDCIERLS